MQVSAHLSNLYNSYVSAHGKSTPNFFDLDRWLKSQLERKNTRILTTPSLKSSSPNLHAPLDLLTQCLLTKTDSTRHIPTSVRSKDAKRAYANFN